jgi:hypothetical protein
MILKHIQKEYAVNNWEIEKEAKALCKSVWGRRGTAIHFHWNLHKASRNPRGNGAE